ncbi:MAG: Gfo/Idh/MocA family protein [Planctomycetota bacterium]
MGDERLRVGVIGLGWHGGGHLANFAANPRAELTAICDVNDQRLAQRAGEHPGVQTFTDYRELLAADAVDAVAVVVPDPLHREPAVAACQASKHVLLEKPMALTVEDAEAIAAAAEATDRCVMLNLSNRWMYPFARGRELLEAGAVGEVRYVFARLSNRIDVPTERLRWLERSHIAHWIGIHRLDIARWWVGREAERVRAVHRRGVLTAEGYDAPDFYQATVEFEGGAVLSLEGSWILPRAHPAMVDSRFYALCTHGVLDVDRSRSELLTTTADAFDLSTPTTGPALDQPGGFTYRASCHFVDCALEGRPPLVTAADGLALTRILCAIVASCEQDGAVIDV